MICENHILTDEQVQHYETFGFIIRRQVFDFKEIERINDEFEKHFTIIKEGSENNCKRMGPRQGRDWPNWSNLIPGTPYMAGLLEDPRIYIPTEQLQGEDTVPVYSNANSFRHNTAWHPDMSQRHIRGLKNLIYLQPTTGNHGSLRLIPGSHISPLFEELIHIGLRPLDDSKNGFLAKSGMQGEDIPAYVFCSQPGDVITFNMNVWHAAFGGYEDRRNCSFGFYSNPKTAQEKEELQAQVENAKKIKTEMKMDLIDSQYYHEKWLENPKGSWKRERWIKWLNEWGFIEALNS